MYLKCGFLSFHSEIGRCRKQQEIEKFLVLPDIFFFSKGESKQQGLRIYKSRQEIKMKSNHVKKNNLTQLYHENRELDTEIDQWTVIVSRLEMAFKYSFSFENQSILYLCNKTIALLNPSIFKRTILC